jgi:hypothetical protein
MLFHYDLHIIIHGVDSGDFNFKVFLTNLPYRIHLWNEDEKKILDRGEASGQSFFRDYTRRIEKGVDNWVRDEYKTRNNTLVISRVRQSWCG